MATNAVTLLNGTTADANDVENKVNPLYTDIDENNVDQTAIMVLTNVDQTVQGEKTFSTANGIKLPDSDPTEDRGVGFENNLLKVHDGSLARLMAISDWLPEGLYNASPDLTSGVFKIVGADGNDWSASNPGILRIKSASGSNLVTLLLTTSPSFQDDNHASSDITGEEFGATTGVVWDEDRPFFIKPVNRDDTAANVLFAITPDVVAKVAPAATNIGYKGNPASTPSDNNFFFLTSSDPSTNYAAKPAFTAGAFRMQMSASDDWAVQTLNGYDGIGQFHEETKFVMPDSQMGADSGKYFTVDSGGTAPTYTDTNLYEYSLSRDGWVRTNQIFINSSGGTAGSGTGALRIGLPYSNVYGSSDSPYYSGSVRVQESTGTSGICVPASSSSSPSMAFFTYANDQLSITASGNSQSTAARSIQGGFIFKAF